jgi:DNA-binding CsgD family transcriptional regulator
LTAREHEVLQLIARGYRYKEIAARLHLSIKTVESHVSSMLRRLQLSSRHELTRCRREGRFLNGRRCKPHGADGGSDSHRPRDTVLGQS